MIVLPANARTCCSGTTLKGGYGVGVAPRATPDQFLARICTEERAGTYSLRHSPP